MAASLALAGAAACGGVARPVPIAPAGLDSPTAFGDLHRAPSTPASPAGSIDESIADSVAIAWRRELGRGIVAPLVIHGPAVLGATTDGRVFAIGRDSGADYWSRRLPGPSAGPIVRAGGRIFLTVVRDGEHTYALDLATGRPVWRQAAGSSHIPPLVVGDTLYAAVGRGGLAAFDARTGEPYWTARLGGALAATPAAHGESLLVATRADTLYRVARASGRVTGRLALPGGASAPAARVGETLYLALHSGTLLAVHLSTLRPAWSAELGAPILAAPAVAGDGTVYVLTEAVELFRFPAGARKPERVASLGGAARGSLALARDRVLVGRLDGTLFLLRADGSIVWRKELDESIVAPVAIAGGDLYVPLLHGTVVKLEGAP